jgi:exosortase E/protease (VPEID-CTERM system)
MSGVTARLCLLVFVLVAEGLAISVYFDVSALFELDSVSGMAWLGHAGIAAKILTVWAAALLVAQGSQLKHWGERLQHAAIGHRYVLPLMLQLCAYSLLFVLSYLVFSRTSQWEVSAISLPLAWVGVLAFVAVLWLNALAPLQFWLRFAREEVLTIGVASFVAALIWVFALVTQNLWDPLSAGTFNSAASLLQLLYADVVAEPEYRTLGVGDFVVEIAAVCSGYEGIGLVLIFTAFYLVIFRQDFRFPQSLLLLPLGVVAIWAFNIFRIAALIVIGAEVSPELALGGFHSLAGWISFVLVTACILLLAHNNSLFARSTRRTNAPSINFRMALLIPLIVLLSTTLITSALTITVDWWYPLRVVLTACALIFLWHHYRSIPFRVTWFAVAIGALVFLLWLVLVPDDPVASAMTDQQLHEAPPSLLIAWLVFRTIGAVVTVPLAEELAFRGYLFELMGAGDSTSRRARFPWFALIFSSVLFGLMHGVWLAGLLAGVAFGLVRCYRGNVVDAFVAHATTNGLLSIYVLTTGNWSLW